MVHIGGFVSPEMPAITRLCGSRGVLLIEDAAHALGAGHGGRPAGSFGDAAAFSFFPTKVVTTAEGGVVTTPHPETADAVRRLRNQGQLHGNATLIGGSGRAQRVQRGPGRSPAEPPRRMAEGPGGGLRPVPGRARREPVRDGPGGPRRGPGKRLQVHRPGGDTAEIREELRGHLARHGVSLAGGVYESLLHDDSRFRRYVSPEPGLFPAAVDFAARHFCLPAWPGLTRPEQDRVIAALDSFRASP